MDFSTYFPLIFLFILLFLLNRRRKTVILKNIIKNRKTEGNTQMKELAKKMIGKDCLIYSLDSNHQFMGVITEVGSSAMLVENNGLTEVINLDFVTRIREYPKNKKGKKKSVVVD